MDVTYVCDLARGIRLAMTVRVLRRRGEVADVARRLVPGAGIRLGPGRQPTSHLRGPSDITRARTELGYEPNYTLEQGMADWLYWLHPPSGDENGHSSA